MTSNRAGKIHSVLYRNYSSELRALSKNGKAAAAGSAAIGTLVRRAALASAIAGAESRVMPMDRTAPPDLSPSGIADSAALLKKAGLLNSAEDAMLKRYCGLLAEQSPRRAAEWEGELARIAGLSQRVFEAHGGRAAALEKAMQDASFLGLCLRAEDKDGLRKAYRGIEAQLADGSGVKKNPGHMLGERILGTVRKAAGIEGS
jgi:hypothetical protein